MEKPDRLKMRWFRFTPLAISLALPKFVLRLQVKYGWYLAIIKSKMMD